MKLPVIDFTELPAAFYKLVMAFNRKVNKKTVCYNRNIPSSHNNFIEQKTSMFLIKPALSEVR